MAKNSEKPKRVEIAAAKGRPMLSWVGKRALRHVPALPAQHVETFDPTDDLSQIKPRSTWLDWPPEYPKSGLLFHGDNKEVLSHLLAAGFRGRVSLVYIDPPFDSGADYVRRVQLRGVSGRTKVAGESHSLGEQLQYTDIWNNDGYLQFMYERLLLIKELMAEDSQIYLHADPSRNYHLRILLDEVFGADAFRNEIVWWYWNKMQGNVNRFASNHDTILCYSKGSPYFKKVKEEREELTRQLKRRWDAESGSLVNARDENGSLIYIESTEKTLDDVWRLSMLQPADDKENLRYPTQKPESLLDIIIESSSAPGDIVLDCFAGSGTTAAVAQKLGRRWIACDINKGAVQTSAKRLQTIIRRCVEADSEDQRRLTHFDDELTPTQLSVCVFRVNDYDLQFHQNEAVRLACEYIGVETRRSDSYFDGALGKTLVKVVPFNHPLSPIDLDDLKQELETRKEEDRDITVICLGMEIAAQAWVDEWNRLRRKSGNVPNRIRVIELRTDPNYAGFLKHDPATAKVKVSRRKSNGTVSVVVEDFISPTIIKRLDMEKGLFQKKVKDWRSMVDCVMIDPSYDGQVFNVVLSDVPEKKNDLVAGEYEVAAPGGRGKTTVAVKIIDMLGEEVLVTKDV
jgi:DNA modification methylase